MSSCRRERTVLDESAELVNRWRQGDERAAAELFQRCAACLIALARSRLSVPLARRLDAEDVVQSAYHSFFQGVRADRFVLERSGDLWRLLVAITLHKLHRQVRKQKADKRDIDRERRVLDEGSLFGLEAEVVAREPSPAEAAAVLDELEEVLRPLAPLHRRMAELRLQGQTVEEIAAEVGLSERMVRLVLEQVRTQLRQRLLNSSTA
jgi:RNA polymerase sigma factor (sigma-70 family)